MYTAYICAALVGVAAAYDSTSVIEEKLNGLLNQANDVQVPFWPYPSGNFTLGSTQLTVDKNFKFELVADHENSLLAAAFKRYERLIDANSSDGIITSCQVTPLCPCE